MYYIHTDFYRFFLKAKKNKLSVNIKTMMNILKKISNNKIIIPTFNWEFPATKKFDVNKDPSQVGIFSEYFRKKKKIFRTKIPMTSSSTNIKKFDRKLNFNKNLDIYGKISDFGILYKNKGKIILFECPFVPTFIIFIENILSHKIKYRYYKYFSGKIIDKQKKVNVKIKYFVQPRKFRIQYDLIKIRKDLIQNKILIVKKYKIFSYDEIDAWKFFHFVKKKINKDDMYLLKKNNKIKLLKILKNKKRGFLKKNYD